jgi:hypothetical protein
MRDFADPENNEPFRFSDDPAVDDTTTTPEPDHSSSYNHPSRRRSGGPRSQRGKQRCSLNSLNHGCRSSIVILRNENPHDLADLIERWTSVYQPDTEAAHELLEQLVLEKWFLLRTERRLAEVEEQLDSFPFTKWTEQQHKIYQLALRYKTTAARAVSKAQRDLEDFLKNRRSDDKHYQQVKDNSQASYRELKKDVEQDEQRWDDSLQKAEAAGADVSEQKAKLITVKEKNRAMLARMREELAALGANKTRAQILFQGQNSPKKLRNIQTLEQWVEVTVENGVTRTTLTPSNQKLIEKGQTMDPPPELVYRRLHFPNGVPDEYSWATDDPLLKRYGGLGIQRMSIDTWLDVLDEEKLRTDGHIGPSGAPVPRPKERGHCDCPTCTRFRNLAEAAESPTEPPAEPSPGS